MSALMSAIEKEADSLYSLRVFRLLTHWRHGSSGFLRAHWTLMPYCSGQLSVLMIEVGCEQPWLRRERRDHRPAKLVPHATSPPTQSKANADGKRALREWHNASMPIVREPPMPPLVHRFVVFAV